MTHYARPATVSSPTSHVDQMMLSRDERFRKRFADSNNDESAIASGGDGGGTDDASGSNPSYRFNGPPPPRHRSSPPRLASPSRTCLTDSEILRSPTEVLYAVSDKRRIRGDSSDVKSVSASVQTMRSELRQNPPGYYAKNPNRPSRNSSREDLLTDDASYVSNVSNGRRSTSLQQQQQRRTPSYSGSKFGHHSARSLERFLDGDDKENAFKTRIQVRKNLEKITQKTLFRLSRLFPNCCGITVDFKGFLSHFSFISVCRSSHQIVVTVQTRVAGSHTRP